MVPGSQPQDVQTLGSQLREVLKDELRRLTQALREDVRAELQQSAPTVGIMSRSPTLSKDHTFLDPEETHEPGVFKLPPLPRSVRGFKCRQYAETFKHHGSIEDIDALMSSASRTPALTPAGLRSDSKQLESALEASREATSANEDRDELSDASDSDGISQRARKKAAEQAETGSADASTTEPSSLRSTARVERKGTRSWSLFARDGDAKRTQVEPFSPPRLAREQTQASVLEVRSTQSSSASGSRKCNRAETFSKMGSNEDLAATLPRSTMGKTRKVGKADKAMALAPAKSMMDLDGVAALPTSQLMAQRLVRSWFFELFVMVMITASAVHIGLQTDYMARHVLRSTPAYYRMTEVAFCVIFTLEIVVRLYAYRRNFLRMYGWAWNAFDLVLVVSQLTEELILAIAGSEQAQDVEAWNTGFLLRTARVLRAIRAIRVLHIARFTNELRLIMSCIVHAMRSFMWASMLLMLMIYVVSIYLTQVVLVHRLDSTTGNMDLSQWYGNVPRSVLSLFQGLTGGLDWDVLAAPLIEHISPWLGVTFFLYTLFAIFAVMNVVTALFVESAIQRATYVKEVQQVDQAMRLFKSLDIHESGIITFEDLEDHLEAPEVQELFRSIDVDVSEARCLFDMLDVNDSGGIDFEEFLNGCMRLQGPAKAIDLLLVAREMRTHMEVQSMLLRNAAGIFPEAAAAGKAQEGQQSTPISAH